jgi:hypothetical protein
LNLTLGEKESIANPLTTGNTSSLETSLNHDPSTTRLWLGALGLPCWNGSNLKTQSDTRKQTSDDKLGQGPCRSLKSTTNDHEEHSQPDSSTTADFVANIEAEQRTEESTNFEGSNSDTLDCGIEGLGEDVEEGLFCDDTTHDRHIITEQPKGAGSDGSNGELKLETSQTHGGSVGRELQVEETHLDNGCDL